jgi:fermentation-respiration switch protein FrsA (DUF1100 family)
LCPILIVHGARDSVVPFAMGEELAAIAGDRATFVAMPGPEHATLVRDGLYDRVWTFLAAL